MRSIMMPLRLAGSSFSSQRQQHMQRMLCNTGSSRRVGQQFSSYFGTTAKAAAAAASQYYDSQSGRHVAVHNDREVSVYLDRTTVSLWDAKDLQLEIAAMNALQQAGLYAGVLVSMESKNKLVTQLTESLAATAPDFTLFMASQGRTNVTYPINTNVITVANYEEDDEEEEDSAEKSSIPEAELTAYMANGTKTSMGLFPDYYYHTNPIVVASEIASLLDKTGGPDFLLLVPEDYACFENPVDGGDAMVKLCEELSYLDVAGPTVKSRLVVGACSEEQVDECLKVGVNKLILPHDDDDTEAFRLHLDWIRAIVEKQGKKIVA